MVSCVANCSISTALTSTANLRSVWWRCATLESRRSWRICCTLITCFRAKSSDGYSRRLNDQAALLRPQTPSQSFRLLVKSTSINLLVFVKMMIHRLMSCATRRFSLWWRMLWSCSYTQIVLSTRGKVYTCRCFVH